jgi:hypothetical protein
MSYESCGYNGEELFHDQSPIKPRYLSPNINIRGRFTAYRHLLVLLYIINCHKF